MAFALVGEFKILVNRPAADIGQFTHCVVGIERPGTTFEVQVLIQGERLLAS